MPSVFREPYLTGSIESQSWRSLHDVLSCVLGAIDLEPSQQGSLELASVPSARQHMSKGTA